MKKSSVLFCSVLFCSVLFCSVLFCSAAGWTEIDWKRHSLRIGNVLIDVSRVKNDSKVAEDSITNYEYYRRSQWNYFKTRIQTVDSWSRSSESIFFGDSIINMLCVESFGCLNFGISGETMCNAKFEIPTILESIHEKRIFIAYGINDLGEGFDETEFINSLNAIIESINTDCECYICAILPVNENISHKFYGKKSNDEIYKINQDLKSFINGKNCSNLHFCDTSKYFIDGNGNLRIDFYNNDGLHPNKLGYEAIIKSLEEAVSNL